RITVIDGRPMHSWDDIVQAIQQGTTDSVVVEVAGKPPIRLPLHRDDLSQRLSASSAVLPYLPPVVGQLLQARPAAKAGLATGDTILAVDGRPITQWYDMVGKLEHQGGVPPRFLIAHGSQRSELTITPDAETIKLPGKRHKVIGRI